MARILVINPNSSRDCSAGIDAVTPALDTTLDVMHGTDAWDTRTKVWQAMNGHILGKAVYVGLFRRPQ